MHGRLPIARGLSGRLPYHFHATILFPVVRAPWEGAVVTPSKEPGQCLRVSLFSPCPLLVCWLSR